ncbi:hypothetical protein GOBAR_AA21576 [Gossypium barbadense]|uniref:Aminotransferase-like plant mobile domain-containing protein n=1 Tax=Gossypium barbadense TaxID=3634 RepID=A0A2P5X6X8_GOSBA|nr:hypothetical protein GOBAR_AA21576 [Gossypium barbadense]
MGKLCGTTGGARRYAATFRSMIESVDSDLRIQAYIPSEILVNPNMQTIPLTPQDIEDLHNINLQGRIDENWVIFQHINIWNHKYKFIPNREPIIARELACDPEYMPWFRHHAATELGPLSTPMQEKASMVTPSLGKHFFAPPPLSPSFYSPTYHTMTIPMPTMFATPIKSPYFLPSIIEETRWQPRSTLQSTMDEGEEVKGPKSQHVPEGRGDFEDEEDE